MPQSKGIIIFAHNNSEFDYLKIACINSLMIQKNLGTQNIILVTDRGTIEWGYKSLGKKFIERCFENIVQVKKDPVFANENMRLFKDTVHHGIFLPFHNNNRWLAYSISHYDETLLLDADYLIMSKAFNNVWGSNNDVMISKDIQDLLFERETLNINYVSDVGIPLYWATAVYFRKSDSAQNLFKIVEHVTKNYNFYRHLYGISSNLFRNDFAFSIAVHMMNGFVIDGIQQLPISKIYKSLDTDDIHSVNGLNDITVYLEKDKEPGNFIMSRIRDIDIHIMNKWSIQRHSDELIEVYK